MDTDQLQGEVTLLPEFKDSSRSNGAYKEHKVIEEIRFVEIALKVRIKILMKKMSHCTASFW